MAAASPSVFHNYFFVFVGVCIYWFSGARLRKLVSLLLLFAAVVAGMKDQGHDGKFSFGSPAAVEMKTETTSPARLRQWLILLLKFRWATHLHAVQTKKVQKFI